MREAVGPDKPVLQALEARVQESARGGGAGYQPAPGVAGGKIY